MTTAFDSGRAQPTGLDPSGSTSDVPTADTPKTTMKRRRQKMPMSGWCEAGNHHICPHLMRAHRFTDKGTELRELVCPCRCHEG